MKKIGILGGAFNPPHIGHLLIAEYVRDELILDEVWFVPTYESPHKENTTVSAKHRLAMLKCAIKDHPHFFIHTIEIDRKGKSYTIDTIRTFTKDFPTYEFFLDRKSTRLNSSHVAISYAVFCLKNKTKHSPITL